MEVDENGRIILQETDHPEFGLAITFMDEKGLGTQIGEGGRCLLLGR